MRRSILFASSIHVFNFPLFWGLSWFYEVQTMRLDPCLKKWRGRIKVIDLEGFIPWDVCVIARDSAVRQWEKFAGYFPAEGWHIQLRGQNIDLCIKAKQDLQKEFLNLVFYQQIMAAHPDTHFAVVYGAAAAFLRSCRPEYPLFVDVKRHPLSGVQCGLDHLVNFITNIGLFGISCLKYTHAAVFNKFHSASIRYIHDDIFPRELSVKKNDISFSWIIDGKLIRKEEILFILPQPDFQMRDRMSPEDMKGINYVLTKHRNTYAKRGVILSCQAEACGWFFRSLVSWRLRDSLKVRYALRALDGIPLVESLRPVAYISTLSAVSETSPMWLYLKALGIRVVVWSYGCYYYLYLPYPAECFFHNLIFAHMLPSTLICWSKDVSRYLGEHPHEGVDFKPMGPLMGGNEAAMGLPKKELCAQLGIPYQRDNRYVAVFDSPVMKTDFAPNTNIYAGPDSAELNYHFLRDVFRLISEFDKMIIVYKPKRSLTSGKFTYMDEQKDLLDQVVSSGRVFILDYNIDPWLVMAISDLNISSPFEAPTTLALQYGKPAIFHDPDGICRHHRFPVPEMITHSYDELIKMVRTERIYAHPDLDPVLKPGESSRRFREFLAGL